MSQPHERAAPAPGWSELVDRAKAYLEQRQERLKSEFELGRFERFDYDQNAGTLSFSSNGRVQVVADMQVVGSTSERGGTWLWAWANPSVLEHLVMELDDVFTYGQAHGLDKLTTAKWPGDESDGWEMTAVAAFVLQSEGAYRAAHDGGALFLTLRNVRRTTVA